MIVSNEEGKVMGEDLELLCKPKTLSKDKTNPTDGSSVEISLSYFTINVFFDGTWNNKFNNNMYREAKSFDERAAIYGDGDGTTSYAREATAIEWLFKGYQPSDNNIGVYIEGTGTFDNEKDSDLAAALGTGSKKGFVAKYERALLLINEELSKKGRKSKVFDILKLNIYGFSRGAASARLFSNRIRRDLKQLKFEKRLQPCQVQLGFIGIFDTVDSVGLNHFNDAIEFEQKLPRSYKVIHITARDEARTYFPLYNIKESAVKNGFGLEFSLPGCHTDIGGGLNIKEAMINGVVVTTGRDEIVDYVHERHNADDEQTDTVYNNQGDHHVSSNFIDNAVFTLLKQKHAAGEVDAKGLADLLVEWGYYDSWSEEKEFAIPNPVADTMESKLVLLDSSSYTRRDRLLSGYRHQIQLGFPRIPCNIMFEFATKYGEKNFTKFKDREESQVPPELFAVYDEFKKKAFDLDNEAISAKKGISADLFLDDTNTSRWLYKNYLHWSGDGKLLDAQLHKNGRWERTEINAHNKYIKKDDNYAIT
jgi:hypothetical protein